MRNKDKQRLTTIRMAISAIKQKEIDERIVINDSVVVEIITKMIKQRRDSYTQYIQADRPELAEGEKHEIEILKVYMPKQLTDDEIIQIVEDAIKSVEAPTMKKMGTIMASIKSKLAGRADMNKVSSIVKSNLV